MTADERLEKLLNRAGQTITDFPTWDGNMRRLGRAKRDALTEMGYRWTDYSPTLGADEIPLTEYILRLAGIIDRMETALENVIGERDYLADVVERGGLFSCEMCALEEGNEDCCVDADFNETGKQPIFRVPEDWRADDETD